MKLIYTLSHPPFKKSPNLHLPKEAMDFDPTPGRRVAGRELGPLGEGQARLNPLFIASVDDDIMPKRALAKEKQKAGGSERRRSSLLDRIGVRAVEEPEGEDAEAHSSDEGEDEDEDDDDGI